MPPKNAKINLRLRTEDLDLMNEAIVLFNKNNSGLELNRNTFLRMSIKLLSDKILNKGLSIEFKPD